MRNGDAIVPSRRKVLSSSGAIIAASLAGCMGGDGEEGGEPTDGTDTGGTTSQPTEKPEEDLGPDEWREKASEEAASELEGEQFTFYMTTFTGRWFKGWLQNNRFDGPYAVLNDKITVSNKTANKIKNQYAREQAADDPRADAINANIGDLITAGVPFLEIDTVPSVVDAPDDTKWMPYMGSLQMSAFGISYNPDLTSEPQNWDALLEDEYKDRQMTADFTPNAPSAAALMEDIKSRDYIRSIAAQEPRYINSVFALNQKVAQGEVKIGFLGMTLHLYVLRSNGLPIAPATNTDMWIWTPLPLAGANDAPHPWAAKLLIDWFMHPDNADIQSARPGTASLRRDRTNPSEMKEILTDDSLVVTAGDFDTPINELRNTYLEVLGAPSD